MDPFSTVRQGLETMLTDHQAEQIFRLLQNEGKLAAVKRYKEMTNCSLFVAKSHVEEMQATGKRPEDSAEAILRGGELTDQEIDQILDAIRSGKKIEAVKIYKIRTEKSLRDSKEFIERLMQELEISDSEENGKTGCSILLFVAIGIVLLNCLRDQ